MSFLQYLRVGMLYKLGTNAHYRGGVIRGRLAGVAGCGGAGPGLLKYAIMENKVGNFFCRSDKSIQLFIYKT